MIYTSQTNGNHVCERGVRGREAETGTMIQTVHYKVLHITDMITLCFPQIKENTQTHTNSHKYRCIETDPIHLVKSKVIQTAVHATNSLLTKQIQVNIK